MFTGLIETVGAIERLRRLKGSAGLRVRCRFRDGPAEIGESIAVDGTCLTVTGKGAGWFEALAAPETLRRTVAGGYCSGRRVNLERAVRASTRMGGHFVQGHVDTTARLRSARPEGESRILRFATPRSVASLIVEKGSVAVDGVSLTVSLAGSGWFEVMLIPHTLGETTLSDRRPGDEVNLEADLIAKYVSSLLGSSRFRG